MKILLVSCAVILFAATTARAQDPSADVPFLLKCLHHPAAGVRDRAAAALRKEGEPAAAGLAVMVQRENMLSSTKAAVLLAQMRSDAEAALPSLLAVLRDDATAEWRWYLALYAINAIGEPGRRDALPFAIKAVQGTQPMKQFAAVQLLTTLGNEAQSAADPLRRLLRAGHAPFRGVVVSDTAIEENLVAFTHAAAVYDDFLILEAMRRVGVPEDEVAAALVSRAASSRPGVRLLAALALSQLGPSAKSAAGATLAELLDAEAPAVREAAVEALPQLGPAAAPATDRLRRMLRDSDPDLRVQAAITLGEIGPAAGAQTASALEEAIQVERLLAGSAGPLSAMARLRAERMTAALDKVRKTGSE